MRRFDAFLPLTTHHGEWQHEVADLGFGPSATATSKRCPIFGTAVVGGDADEEVQAPEPTQAERLAPPNSKGCSYNLWSAAILCVGSFLTGVYT